MLLIVKSIEDYVLILFCIQEWEFFMCHFEK